MTISVELYKSFRIMCYNLYFFIIGLSYQNVSWLSHYICVEVLLSYIEECFCFLTTGVSLYDWSGQQLDKQTRRMLHQNHAALASLTALLNNMTSQATPTTEQGNNMTSQTTPTTEQGNNMTSQTTRPQNKVINMTSQATPITEQGNNMTSQATPTTEQGNNMTSQATPTTEQGNNMTSQATGMTPTTEQGNNMTSQATPTTEQGNINECQYLKLI